MVSTNKTSYTFLFFSLTLLLSGCATLSEPAPPNVQYSKTELACIDLIDSFDELVQRNNVADQADVRIAHYPFLRTNRFLSSFSAQLETREQYEALVERLRKKAVQGWRYEIANLGQENSAQLLNVVAQLEQASVDDALEDCSNVMKNTVLRQGDISELLLDGNRTPDAYSTWQRVFGLYPLVSPFFKLGILQWHEETRAIHAQHPDDLPVNGELVYYRNEVKLPATELTKVKQQLNGANQNTLGIPEPDKQALQSLFKRFSPVFEVDTVDNNDRIGSIFLNNNTQPEVNTSEPAFYQYVTHTRLDGQILLQLNYMIWFPSRPKTSAMDLLGGELDGIIWRVTLLPDGKPLVYDSIHTCGCYHLVFPTQYAVTRTNQTGYEEPLLILNQIDYSDGEQLYIRIASGTHYIDRVTTSTPVITNPVAVTIKDANSLRSLPAGQQYKSLYGNNAIISTSARLERFLFWPMGVISPGAMRQPGHHATAFVGRRHFDDAHLFAPYLSINGELTQ